MSFIGKVIHTMDTFFDDIKAKIAGIPNIEDAAKTEAHAAVDAASSAFKDTETAMQTEIDALKATIAELVAKLSPPEAAPAPSPAPEPTPAPAPEPAPTPAPAAA